MDGDPELTAEEKHMPHIVAYAHASGYVGGGNHVLLRIIAGLDRNRFSPVSLIPAHGPIESELRALDVPYSVIDLRMSHLSPLKQVAQVARLLGENLRRRPVIIHSVEAPYRAVGLGALRAKTVCHIHHPGLTPAAVRWMMWRVPDVVLTPTEFVAGQVRECLRSDRPAPPLHVVGTPIDTTWFRPAKDLVDVRQRLGIEPTDRHISILGTMAPHKGHECFLRMAKLVLRHVPNCRFHIVGSDMVTHREHVRRLKRIAGDLGVTDRVRFWGEVAREIARDILASSDVFVLPTTEEGFCMALAEAQACQVPVVSSRIQPLDEVVEDGKSGILLPPEDAEAFAERTILLLNNESMRQSFGATGRRLVQERFGQVQYVSKITHIYESLAR